MNASREVEEYLTSNQWLQPHENANIHRLDGGVSNNVWKITTERGSWVMKQALPKLMVEADWFADVARIEREQSAMLILAPMLTEGVIPKVVFQDQANHIYMMKAASDKSRSWKSLLMEGSFDSSVAFQAGRMLQHMHVKSGALSPEQIEVLQDLTFFKQLRIDPFHLHVAERYPELRHRIQLIVEELTTPSLRSSLVHGDYSPKNILVAPGEPIVVLDFEVSHWGNPVFDVAFCLSHLLLKGWGLDRRQDAWKMIDSFLEGYDLNNTGLAAHTGILLLSRLDGKSPVDYVRNEALRRTIRETAFEWIKERPRQAEMRKQMKEKMMKSSSK